MGVARPALPAWTAQASASRVRFARCMLTGPAVGAADQGVERRQQQGQAMKAMHASEALDHQPPDAAHARTTRPRDTADQMACHSAGTCTGTGRCSNGGDLCYFRAQLRAAGGALALSGRLLRPPCAV
jgi:hypothetical protein